MALTKVLDAGLSKPASDLQDNDKITLGTGNDFEIVHDGSNSYIQEDGTGQIIIRGWSPRIQTGYSPTSSRNSGEDSIVCITDGSVELYYDTVKKFETKSYGCNLVGNLHMTSADSQILKFGAGNDLQIYHNGSTSFIEDSIGDFRLRSDALKLQSAGGENYVHCTSNGAVNLYNDNKLNLATTGSGVKVSSPDGEATLQIEGFEANAATLQFNADEGDDHADFWRLRNGTGTDFSIENYADSAWEKSIECNETGNVELYFDNSKKFDTFSGGCKVYGDLHLPTDSEYIWFGDSDDLKIGHDGSNSYLLNTTGNLIIKDTTGSIYAQSTGIYFQDDTTNENIAKFISDGACELYHDNVKRLETTDAGIKITGQSKGVCTQNLIHNGAMVLSQRGHFQNSLSGAANGFHIDRWKMVCQGVNENPTMLKHDLTNAEAPWDEGFRFSLLLRNGDQTGGGGAGDFMFVRQIIEARNLRHSGWNFKDPNSFITLSFWVKSSVAQNFYGFCKTNDGSAKLFPWETGTLSANTWTKVTVTMPGEANISFDENNGAGMELNFAQFYGTNYTHPSDPTYNQWNAWDSGKRALNYGTAMDDWYETNDAEFELTGVQLEVGKVANAYKFQSLHEIMMECKRYYHLLPGSGTTFANCFNGCYNSDTELVANFWFPNEMRGSPSFEYGTALSDFDWEPHDEVPNNLSLRASNTRMASIQSTGHTDNNRQGHAAVLTIDTSAGYVAFYNDY